MKITSAPISGWEGGIITLQYELGDIKISDILLERFRLDHKGDQKMNFKYIVWHTAAHATKQGVAIDTTAEEINKWHKANGWEGIGYQKVIRFNGDIEDGRSYGKAGAHVAGMNSIAIGYCFSGHGDFAPLTLQQLATGLDLTRQDMQKYGIYADNVIGHREVNRIIVRDHLTDVPPVNKSCPGKLVDMDNIRSLLVNSETMIRYASTQPDLMVMNLVKKLQYLLLSLGIYDGDIDGWAGEKTSNAMKQLFGHYLEGDPRI